MLRHEVLPGQIFVMRKDELKTVLLKSDDMLSAAGGSEVCPTTGAVAAAASTVGVTPLLHLMPDGMCANTFGPRGQLPQPSLILCSRCSSCSYSRNTDQRTSQRTQGYP